MFFYQLLTQALGLILYNYLYTRYTINDKVILARILINFSEFNDSKYCTPNQMMFCGLFVNVSNEETSGREEDFLFNYFIKSGKLLHFHFTNF